MRRPVAPSIAIARATQGESGVMPSRFVSLAILIYWLIAAFCLLTWDVIPELALGISSRLAGDCAGRRFVAAGAVEHPGDR